MPWAFKYNIIFEMRGCGSVQSQAVFGLETPGLVEGALAISRETELSDL